MEEVELKHEIIEEITAPNAVVPVPPAPLEIAYQLTTDYGDFPILKTNSGFWKHSTKLEVMLGLIKKGYSLNQALGTVGVLWGSWKYFEESHPWIVEVIEATEQSSIAPFLDTLHSDGAKDLTTVRWAIGKRDERYKPEKKVEAPVEVLQPTQEAVVNQVHVETININANEISRALADFSSKFFGASPEVSQAIAAEVVAEIPKDGSQ